MIRPWALSAALVLCAAPLPAQKLRARLGELVTFGGWGVPLRVGAPSADGSALVANDAFGTSAANGALVAFLVQWMSANASSAPIPSTGGGTAFRFEGGAPVRTTPAPGPIFGEAATTLGRGAVLGGANYTGVHFSKVRGVPLDGVDLTLTPGATGAAGDVIDLRVAVDYDMAVTSFFTTVGVLDRVDVGVVVPLVRSRLRGESNALVVPGSTGAPQTIIGGTPGAPVLASAQSMDGSATGLGDVAVRVKANLLDHPRSALGVLADVRAPTGDEEDLLGSGTWAVRALALWSGRLARFTPHASAGYLRFDEAPINDAVLATLGTDYDAAPWATVAVSALGQFHPGASEYQLPHPAGVRAANIPDIRDDAVSASLGVKLSAGGVRTVVNVLAPLTRGGPRPDFAYTVGVERNF